jgi:predicted RNA-binding protein with PUA-like domain
MTASDPRTALVHHRRAAQPRLKRSSLDELRAHAGGKLRGMGYARFASDGSRLSVMPVDDAHWRFILSLE